MRSLSVTNDIPLFREVLNGALEMKNQKELKDKIMNNTFWIAVNAPNVQPLAGLSRPR